jgi:hypothetical protein
VANEYVDEVLQYVHVFVRDNDLREIATPGIEATFSKEVRYCYTESATLNLPKNRFAYCRLYNKFMATYCPFQILWITWHGRFAASNGKARDLASLTRTGDISLDYDLVTGGITVFGNLGLSELDVSRYLVSLGSVHISKSRLAVSPSLCERLAMKVYKRHELPTRSIIFK